jgi:hypothetical protein
MTASEQYGRPQLNRNQNYKQQKPTQIALTCLLGQFSPAGVESVILVLRGVQFQQCLLEGGGVAGDLGIFNAVVSCC